MREALWLLGIVPVVAAKFTELWPTAMLTVGGTVTNALLLLSDTTAATVAALVRATVQVVDEFPPTVDGVQVSALNCAGATRLSVVGTETAPALAVTMALWSVPTWAAVAVKLAVVWPEEIVTLAGTLKLALLLPNETTNPAAGAPKVIEAVHEVLPGVLIVALVHARPLSAGVGGGSVIDPEVPVAGMEVPFGSEATTPVSWTVIGEPEAFGAIWSVAVATTPFTMGALLNPKIMQLLPEQETDFPAFVAETPATTVTPVMAAG